jgi:hypothetical protein
MSATGVARSNTQRLLCGKLFRIISVRISQNQGCLNKTITELAVTQALTSIITLHLIALVPAGNFTHGVCSNTETLVCHRVNLGTTSPLSIGILGVAAVARIEVDIRAI